MRKIICRFANEDDLNELSKTLNIELTQNTTKCNLETKECVAKKRTSRIYPQSYWETQWIDMPYFRERNSDYEYAKIEFYTNKASNQLGEMFGQAITDATKSIWFPKLIHGKHRNIRYLFGNDPKYPIYVISKGRSWLGKSHTSNRLSQMNIPHYLVVEPQEYLDYARNFTSRYVTILTMDLKYKETYDTFSDLGNTNSCGPGAVRNFCWEHSIENGFGWHWVMDDNLEGFERYVDGKRYIVYSGEAFRSLEDFVERYDNIAIAGLNYSNFCTMGSDRPAFVLNTRVYSCLLIRNDIPYRWRGRYNEDTDLSLRVLKDGWCTVLFNLFLCGKRCTQQKKGGNTDEFYAKEGTYPKSKMLVDMHPDVAKLVWKFNRVHHYVDYSKFVQKLRLKSDYIKNDKTINEKGMVRVEIPWEWHNDPEKDNREYLEKVYANNAECASF